MVVQEKDASESQDEDGMELGQRKVCPWVHLHLGTQKLADRSCTLDLASFFQCGTRRLGFGAVSCDFEVSSTG